MPKQSPRFDFVELHILYHASEAPLYGLWMLEELAEHGYKLNASQLYPRFHRLLEQQYLTRMDKAVDGRIRKYYRITPDGRAYLREQKRRLMELISEALTVDELSRALERRRKREEGKRRSS